MKESIFPEQIETKRLLLCRLSQEYVDVYYNNFTDNITRYMYPSTPASIKDISDWIDSAEKKMQSHIAFYFVILDKSTKDFFGSGGIHELHASTPEPGIWIKEAAWGHQYGLEAVKAVIDWTRKNYEFDYIKYPADIHNVGSCRIAEALGGKTDGSIKELVTPTGKVLNILEYKIR